jgi:Fe-S-cluster containining protein
MPACTDHSPARCDRCPAICCQLPVWLAAGDDPPAEYVDLDENGLEIMGKADDGWCAALDRESMSCGIYARRPLACREFDMDGPDCHDERDRWRRIAVSLAR